MWWIFCEVVSRYRRKRPFWLIIMTVLVVTSTTRMCDRKSVQTPRGDIFDPDGCIVNVKRCLPLRSDTTTASCCQIPQHHRCCFLLYKEVAYTVGVCCYRIGLCVSLLQYCCTELLCSLLNPPDFRTHPNPWYLGRLFGSRFFFSSLLVYHQLICNSEHIEVANVNFLFLKKLWYILDLLTVS